MCTVVSGFAVTWQGCCMNNFVDILLRYHRLFFFININLRYWQMVCVNAGSVGLTAFSSYCDCGFEKWKIEIIFLVYSSTVGARCSIYFGLFECVNDIPSAAWCRLSDTYCKTVRKLASSKYYEYSVWFLVTSSAHEVVCDVLYTACGCQLLHCKNICRLAFCCGS